MYLREKVKQSLTGVIGAIEEVALFRSDGFLHVKVLVDISDESEREGLDTVWDLFIMF